jgi:hypothetical protein
VALFTTNLQNGIKIDISSGNHIGFMRYTFPILAGLPNNRSTFDDYPTMAGARTANEHDAHVPVDLTHVLPAYSGSCMSDLPQTRYHHTMDLQPTQVAGRSLILTRSTFAGTSVSLRALC